MVANTCWWMRCRDEGEKKRMSHRFCLRNQIHLVIQLYIERMYNRRKGVLGSRPKEMQHLLVKTEQGRKNQQKRLRKNSHG